MFLLIGLRAFSCEQFEILMKAGEIVETAFITELFDADAVVEQQLAGVSDAYFREKLRIGLAGAGLEIAAEGIGDQAGDGGYLLKVYRPREMTEGIVVNSVDAVVLRLCKIGAKADGGE